MIIIYAVLVIYVCHRIFNFIYVITVFLQNCRFSIYAFAIIPRGSGWDHTFSLYRKYMYTGFPVGLVGSGFPVLKYIHPIKHINGLL